MAFTDKNLRPWSPLWILQRFIVVVREGRLRDIHFKTLLWDLKLTRRINRGLLRSKAVALPDNDSNDISVLFNLNTAFEYRPLIVNENMDESSLPLLNQVFDHIYVVNLPRRQDRRVLIIQQLMKLGIKAEIFEAEDGYTQKNVEDFNAFYTKPFGTEGTHELERSLKKKMILSPGGWGYLLSYRKLLEDAKKKKYRRILCLDDDVVFHRDFHTAFHERINQVPGNWKLLYLGASQHIWEKESLHVAVKEDGSLAQPYYFPLKTDGSFALGIDHSVFDELLLEINRMNCSVDSGALRSIQKKYLSSCYVCFPNLIIADASQSDIGVDRDQRSLARRLKWNLSDYDYPYDGNLVSVIMPAFNAEKTIEKAIRSVLLQTYRNLEMIVADDGSTDNTPGIVQRLSQEDSRVKLVRLEENRGCYPARNAALRASQGKYIAIQDSDDISLKTRIATQLVPLVLGKAEFTLTRIFRSRCAAEELDIYQQKEMISLVLDRRVKSPSGFFEYRDRPVIGFMTSMFTRRLFEEMGLFWENRFGADAEFLERVLCQKAGILLSKKDGTVHSYLMEKKDIPGIYERIDKVQLISIGMTGDNITNRHSQEEKDAFEETWRKRLRGEIDYKYPVF